jgi:hypothetical protein
LALVAGLPTVFQIDLHQLDEQGRPRGSIERIRWKSFESVSGSIRIS